jgi:proteasome lid subunit RPN8/RPN11
MPLRLKKSVLDQIRAHAEEAYPEECCGLLAAYPRQGGEDVEAIRMRNTHPAPRHNRYSMDPMDLYQADREVARRGGTIIGIYHSHPDHPPQPSAFDLQHAWPGISYLIISVYRGKSGEARSWVLDEERTGFREETLEIL